jgi:hypothetical protein
MDELLWTKRIGQLRKHIAEVNASAIQGFFGKSPKPVSG